MDDRHTPPRETWASGAAYESYVGRWSWRVAREFLNWLRERIKAGLPIALDGSIPLVARAWAARGYRH